MFLSLRNEKKLQRRFRIYRNKELCWVDWGSSCFGMVKGEERIVLCGLGRPCEENGIWTVRILRIASRCARRSNSRTGHSWETLGIFERNWCRTGLVGDPSRKAGKVSWSPVAEDLDYEGVLTWCSACPFYFFVMLPNAVLPRMIPVGFVADFDLMEILVGMKSYLASSGVCHFPRAGLSSLS